MRRFLLPSIIAGSVLAVAAMAVSADPQVLRAQLARNPHVPDELLVQYRAQTSLAARRASRERVSLRHLETIAPSARRGDGGGDLQLVRVPAGLALADAIERLAADPEVEFAEPNWIYHHDAEPDDPRYVDGDLWGLYGPASTPANAYGSRAAEAWAATGADCSTVYVGVIDEGFFYRHADLAANAGKNPGESRDPDGTPNPDLERNGVDDDGNGYVDDVHGWDFVGDNNAIYDGTLDDHGTHVAGIIGAVGNNARGVAGVCWRVQLLGAKFLGAGGGTTAGAIRAVDYFTDLKTRPVQPVDIVATNNSWGGGGFSRGMQEAIERAGAAGILFVAAAGNGGNDAVGDDNDLRPHYPASYPNANLIAVASINANGGRSGFSNYGARTVDIGAPGSGIVSTVPRSGRNASGYANYSGTSMAAPFVTGAIALYAATHPGAAAAQIRAAILDAAIPTPALAGKTVSGGRLDIGAALLR